MYLLDTNAFLTPANSYYAFDICGGYWSWLIEAAEAGELGSINQVKRELRQKDDQIRNWIDAHATKLFIPETSAVTPHMKQVATWTTSGKFTQAASSDFLSKADSMLVAKAMECGGTVITLETSDVNSKKRVKIPDACIAHGVTYMTPYELLRKKGVRLIK